MKRVVLVDTDVLIDTGRGLAAAVASLQHLERAAPLAVSTITQMELAVGCRNKSEFKALKQLLLRFQLLRLTEAVSDRAVNLLERYRLSHGLLIPDALIAASALEFDCPLLTKNQRDYRFITGLTLLPYPNVGP
ncbi:MAG: type II toxin-antitoxin system VapC family toxin [Candidatus Riflebacteria bacterium]|nr:type II toxin-antitoxin system VapC family toxin [Candidatus Riflebacteria bacterium]